MNLTANEREWLIRLGYRVRDRLEYLEMPQNECAKRSGLTQPEISAIVHGKLAPTVITIRRLCVALAMKPSDLLDF